MSNSKDETKVQRFIRDGKKIQNEDTGEVIVHWTSNDAKRTSRKLQAKGAMVRCGEIRTDTGNTLTLKGVK